MAELLESFARESFAVLIDTSLNACQEILKFVFVLLILYYFTSWSFQFIDEVLQALRGPSELMLQIAPYDFDSHQLDSLTNSKIMPNLLEQLEIEAEFEDNMERNRPKELLAIKSRASEEEVPETRSGPRSISSIKDLFISQIKQEPNETSRPSQTEKTSLGKKSKLREYASPSRQSKADDEDENPDVNKITNENISTTQDDKTGGITEELRSVDSDVIIIENPPEIISVEPDQDVTTNKNPTEM